MLFVNVYHGRFYDVEGIAFMLTVLYYRSSPAELQ